MSAIPYKRLAGTVSEAIQEFVKLESLGGILLIAGTFAALVFANSPLAHYYESFLDTPVEIRIGEIHIAKPALLWINDGLMAVFFFLIGLELKREFMEGELSTPGKIVLPAAGALGGMLVPAAIFTALNWNNPITLRGWAIPVATDIAFALGIMSMLGKRVPLSLKIFLVSLAIFDDMGAILIIAIFYLKSISFYPVIFAGVMIVVLLILNLSGVSRKMAFLIVGIALWVAVLKSGIHATIAGVILAFFIPLKAGDDNSPSPLRELEHDLHSTVSYGILPLFAFANAGVSLDRIGISSFVDTLPLGIFAGLFIGKQLGVFAFCWLAVKLGFAAIPEKASWRALYGVSILCGIGFTMSLFISSLAFESGTFAQSTDERVGILAGSFLAAVVGYMVLRGSLPRDEGSNLA